MRTNTFFAGILLLFGFSIVGQQTNNRFNNLNSNDVIIDGYDPVAFYTEKQPVKGSESFTYKYDGANYHFASKKHLDLFKENPEKYKPQYGGWCAYAVSLGRVAPINVDFWSIQDGRLLLQHNKRAEAGWAKDPPENLILADKYWPEVSAKHGDQILTEAEKAFYNNTNNQGISIGGYDPIAYFTLNKAVKGSEKYQARFQGATYWFSTQENAEMFKNNSKMFAPSYGGFCGYAMSDGGRRRPVNPKIYTIVDGHLILQHSKTALKLWEKNVQDSKDKADGHWPNIVKKFHGQKTEYDN